MDDKTLQQECRKLVDNLDLPSPFDLAAFCAQLAANRGRPISLVALRLPAGAPFGLWAVTDHTDYIFYERNTTLLHQTHIVLHELSHLLCGHHRTPVQDQDVYRLLMPDLNPTVVQQVLARNLYTREEERQAELVATLILQRAQATTAPLPAAIPAEMAELARHLQRSLAPDPSGPEHAL